MSSIGRPTKNTLQVGTSRLGFIVDGNPDTPEMATLLENDGTSIQLTIPFTGMYGDAYRRWFSGNGVMYDDDPDRTRFSYKIPECLEFRDHLGHASLVGCRERGYNENIMWMTGSGRVSVDYVVLGGRGGARYERINGLRSELVGLGDWMGLRSLTQDRAIEKGKLATLSLHLKAPDPIPISNRLNLCVAPSFTSRRTGSDTTTVQERMYVQTHVSKARPWEEHLELHRAMRDLVSLSSWRESKFSSLTVTRDDDPAHFGSHEVLQKWNPVVAAMIDTSEDATSKATPLFTFHDIDRTGVAAWVRLRSHFRRGVDPILSSLFNSSTVQSGLADVGIGFEALGYQLALDAGLSKTKAGNESHHDRLLRVGYAVTLPLPFTIDRWAKSATDAYNGIKHANRSEVDVIDALNAWRETVLVFRAWVATRIGATDMAVADRLVRDRMTNPYTAG